MSKTKPLRFSRENMWTVTGFVLDSFENHQQRFVDVLGEETFGADFLTKFGNARLKIKGLTGAGLRIGAGTQVTERLYGNLDKVKPLLNLIDVRLGMIPKADLTVAPKKFGLPELRYAINSRNAEVVSRGLVTLVQLIGDNRTALNGKGYKEQELLDLVELQGLIDADNLLQNKTNNDSQELTPIDDAHYVAMDELLGQVLRAGMLLFKEEPEKRQQYNQRELQRRVDAGERPKPRPGDDEA